MKTLKIAGAIALALLCGLLGFLQETQSFASGISQAIIPQAVPIANKQGNGTKFALFSGPVTAQGYMGTWDANGNITQSGIPMTGSSTLSQYPNAALKTLWGGQLASGATDLYLVPANRKAVVFTCGFANTTGTTRNVYMQVKISGSYYRLANIVAIIANNYATSSGLGFVMEAGESLAINADGAAAVNVFGTLIEFDNTAPWKSARLTSFVNGDNVLYTVPAAKQTKTQAGDNANYMNDSGGAVNTQYWQVPSGQIVGTSTQLSALVSVANGSQRQGPPVGFTMNVGDSIVLNVNSDAAGQFAWLSLLEF